MVIIYDAMQCCDVYFDGGEDEAGMIYYMEMSAVTKIRNIVANDWYPPEVIHRIGVESIEGGWSPIIVPPLITHRDGTIKFRCQGGI